MEPTVAQVTEFRGKEDSLTQQEDSLTQQVGNGTNSESSSQESEMTHTTEATVYANPADTGNAENFDQETSEKERQKSNSFYLGDESPSTSEQTSQVVPPSYAKSYDNPAFEVTFEDGIHERAVVSFVIDDDDDKAEVHEKQRRDGMILAITSLLSLMYGTVLILVGFAIPLSEALTDVWMSSTVVSIYNIYLYAGSSAFLIYVMVNIWMYQSDPVNLAQPLQMSPSDSDMRAKEVKEDTKHSNSRQEDNLTLYITRNASSSRLPGDGISVKDDHTPQNRNFLSPNSIGMQNGSAHVGMINASSFSSLSHQSTNGQPVLRPGEIYEEVLQLRQTATLGHDGASFYFRLGALAFGMANFIFVVVQIDHYINEMDDCDKPPDYYPLFFHLFFIMVQTFFIFKHTHVHIKKFKGLARFGVMHVLATNMCNWLRYLVFEVVEGMYELDVEDYYEDDETGALASDSVQAASFIIKPAAEGNVTSCIHQAGLYMELAPYLFPFVLEYSLIATATMAGIYHTLNIQVTQDIVDNIKRAIKKRRESPESHMTKDDHQDILAKAHRGMFGGALLLGGSVVSVIMFHYASNENDSASILLKIYYISDLALHALMIPSIFYCATKLRKFKFSFTRDNSIDNTLLLIALAGLVLYYMFIMIASIAALVDNTVPEVSQTASALAMTAAVINIIQAVLQGIFVVAGLQMCAANIKHMTQKPGRGSITYLVIGNLTVWIFKSFQVKAVDYSSPVQFYGSTAWPIIKNTGLPLVLFFRFHVSVCLADMFNHLYHMDTDSSHTVLN